MMAVNGLLGVQPQQEIYRGSTVEHSAERENSESAARARYNRAVQQERRALREALRSGLPAAHMGLGVTVVVLIAVAGFSGPQWTLIIAGALSAWFLLALAVIHISSGRGRDAVRRAYIATFGWGNWI
ncbi:MULTISPECIES: hypothetical protein [unclassified Streptomyces]|uniref:hypothetical protein n=1 Tax=Streptomyces TaxID=1883 RepID=UPI001F0C86B2|nr:MULTISPECIES: hypothetical protein [unclassified Streptomyces]